VGDLQNALELPGLDPILEKARRKVIRRYQPASPGRRIGGTLALVLAAQIGAVLPFGLLGFANNLLF
jgi:hypothetical protein